MTFNDRNRQRICEYIHEIWSKGYNLQARKIVDILFSENLPIHPYDIQEIGQPFGATYYLICREDRRNEVGAQVMTYFLYDEDPDYTYFESENDMFNWAWMLYLKFVLRAIRPYSPFAQPLSERDFLL